MRAGLIATNPAVGPTSGWKKEKTTAIGATSKARGMAKRKAITRTSTRTTTTGITNLGLEHHQQDAGGFPPAFFVKIAPIGTLMKAHAVAFAASSIQSGELISRIEQDACNRAESALNLLRASFAF